jgi:3-oxoacyl-[acyl-carrier-protein] synthase I
MGDPLCVSAVGMVSAVGYTATASCAAARAGISLAREVGSLRLEDPTTGETVPVVGHAVRGLSDGYVGVGRLIRLASRALSDLYQELGLAELDQTALLLALPGEWYRAERERQRREGVLPPEDSLQDESATYPRRASPLDEIRNVGTRTMLRLAGLPADMPARCFPADEVAFADALDAAWDELESGAVRRCIVGGVDSWVDDDALELAADLGLLKSDANPVGFMPGEAAAFVALERVAEARRHGARTRALLHRPARAVEPFGRCSGQPALGVALARVLLEAGAEIGGGNRRAGFLVGSLNGDAYRAQDFGAAVSRASSVRHLGELPHWRPVGSFGQIGAALGPAAVALCAHAWWRDYAPSDDALVWLASDHGGRAALGVSRAAD